MVRDGSEAYEVITMLKKAGLFIGLLRDMMKVLNKKQRRNCTVVFVMIVVGGFLELLGVSAVLPVVKIIMTPDKAGDDMLYSWFVRLTGLNGNREVILGLSVSVVLLYLVKNVYLTLSTYMQARLVADTRYTLSEKSLRAYIRNDYAFFVNENSSVILRGLTSDIDAYLNTLQNYFNIGVRLINVFLICVWLFCTDIVLTLIVVGLGLVSVVIITGILKRKMRTMGALRRNAEGNMLKDITQIVTGMKEIKILGRRDYFVKHYGETVKKRCSIDVGYTTLSPLPERIIETVFIGGLIMAVGVLSYMGKVDGTFVANLSIFAVASFRMLPFVSQLSGCLNILMFSYEPVTAALNNLKSTISNGEMIKAEDDDCIAGERIDGFNRELVLSGLSFAYSPELPNVLDGIDLKVEKGDSVALVGPSGAGKTTLADVILGLNRITGGRIAVDGKEIDLGERSWGGLIGYVSQNIFMLDDTIKNNIAFGCGQDEIDNEKLKDVIKKAQLNDFIDSLPDGLETQIGESGAKISGGQKQRIAIARALYFNPEILILDEATSALDNDTEKAVMEAIGILKGEKTLIIVAHRLSTISKCNHIYEVRDGALTEKKLVDGILTSMDR